MGSDTVVILVLIMLNVRYGQSYGCLPYIFTYCEVGTFLLRSIENLLPSWGNFQALSSVMVYRYEMDPTIT